MQQYEDTHSSMRTEINTLPANRPANRHICSSMRQISVANRPANRHMQQYEDTRSSMRTDIGRKSTRKSTRKSSSYICPHTTMCVLILLHVFPYTPICVRILLCVSSYYCYICVLILLYICPHTTIYVSSYYICVLVLLYVFAYCNISSVLILQHIHTDAHDERVACGRMLTYADVC